MSNGCNTKAKAHAMVLTTNLGQGRPTEKKGVRQNSKHCINCFGLLLFSIGRLFVKAIIFHETTPFMVLVYKNKNILLYYIVYIYILYGQRLAGDPSSFPRRKPRWQSCLLQGPLLRTCAELDVFVSNDVLVLPGLRI